MAKCQRTPDPWPPMWVPTMDVLLHRWFTDYGEAKLWRDAEGGYLLPYRGDFFVTEASGIRELGLDPADPDWERIGRDWIHPHDPKAWERLRQKREIEA